MPRVGLSSACACTWGSQIDIVELIPRFGTQLVTAERMGLNGIVKINRASLFDLPAEHIIAVGRVVFCLLLLSAIAVQPGYPFQEVSSELAVLAAYSAFAFAILAVRVWRLSRPWSQYLIHLIDIAAIVTLWPWAQERIGAFFAVFMLFLLLAASLRWAWRGVVATALGLSGITLIRGIANEGLTHLSGYLIESAYVLVSGGMIAYLSALRQRYRDQVITLADWPAPTPSQLTAVSLENLLAHCAVTLEVPRVLAIWEEAEEPDLNIAVLQNGHYCQMREIAGAFGDFLTTQRFATTAFWTDNSESGVIFTHQGPIRSNIPIIDKNLIVNYHIRSVGTAPFRGALCKGRLFVLDRSSWSDFQLLLTEIIAARIGNALDRQIMQFEARDAAALMERDQLAHDVHDGFLQGLAAIGLQLKLVTDGNPEDVKERVDTIKQLVNQEQRRIREFLRKKVKAKLGDDILLCEELQKIESEAARLWKCRLSFSIDPPDARVSDKIGFHLTLMLMEAVANAARHGRASLVCISIRTTVDAIYVQVQDNGAGFSEPVLSEDAEVKTELRPASLRARINKLGGSLSVNSSANGVELKIRLPKK
jgi:signal transduction histidine kinase